MVAMDKSAAVARRIHAAVQQQAVAVLLVACSGLVPKSWHATEQFEVVEQLLLSGSCMCSHCGCSGAATLLHSSMATSSCGALAHTCKALFLHVAQLQSSFCELQLSNPTHLLASMWRLGGWCDALQLTCLPTSLPQAAHHQHGIMCVHAQGRASAYLASAHLIRQLPQPIVVCNRSAPSAVQWSSWPCHLWCQ